MHYFRWPWAFIHHDSSRPNKGQLTVRSPNFRFQQTFNLHMLPVNAFDIAGRAPQAQDHLAFSLHGVRRPYLIECDFVSDDPHLTCVLLHPSADIVFDDDLYKNYSTPDVPVRTVNLKHNGEEIAQTVPDLDPAYNFKSWVDAYLKSGDHLKFRLFLDMRYIQTVNRNLTML